VSGPPFTDEEYRLFRDWISKEYGLTFGPEKRDILRSRLEPRRRDLGFASYRQLHSHLKFHPEREAERARLLPYLTNNESYFFREKAQLELLRDDVLPELAERARAERREVRILSAACAGGEEPYSIAILLREMPAGKRPDRVRLSGMDVDPEALARARRGVYTPHAFRGIDDARRDRYFRQTDEGWVLDAGIRGDVHFHQGNLLDPGWPSRLGRQDVIFCRNVLIYFDGEATLRTAQHIHAALRPEGALFLGHAESVSRVPVPFRTCRRPGTIFYRREEG
jgi:chemotaxis protein methyltransferase CheR